MMQLLIANPIVFSIKKFDPDNVKKPSLKVAHNRSPIFFYVLARLSKRLRNRNPVPP